MTLCQSLVVVKGQLILNGLNNRQEEAVKSITSETLVIAGAGSGKTAVLTRRVAYLISQGVIPGNILCLTFTNKAAKEMNQRVLKLLRESGYNIPEMRPWEVDYVSAPLLCTFHSLGVRILREYGEKIGLRTDFNILDTADQKGIVSQILKDMNIDRKAVSPKLCLYFISLCKQELLIAKDATKLSSDFPEMMIEIYKRYEKKLQDNHNVDFDDLIMRTYILLRDHKEVRTALHQRWLHIMIDEFQDTNEAQFALVKMMYSGN